MFFLSGKGCSEFPKRMLISIGILTESDGYPKTAHRDMDLHNNEVGREIGEKNKEASESEMADIIYQEIYSATTSFIWLHE